MPHIERAHPSPPHQPRSAGNDEKQRTEGFKTWNDPKSGKNSRGLSPESRTDILLSLGRTHGRKPSVGGTLVLIITRTCTKQCVSMRIHKFARSSDIVKKKQRSHFHGCFWKKKKPKTPQKWIMSGFSSLFLSGSKSGSQVGLTHFDPLLHPKSHF